MDGFIKIETFATDRPDSTQFDSYSKRSERKKTIILSNLGLFLGFLILSRNVDERKKKKKTSSGEKRGDIIETCNQTLLPLIELKLSQRSHACSCCWGNRVEDADRKSNRTGGLAVTVVTRQCSITSQMSQTIRLLTSHSAICLLWVRHGNELKRNVSALTSQIMPNGIKALLWTQKQRPKPENFPKIETFLFEPESINDSICVTAVFEVIVNDLMF